MFYKVGLDALLEEKEHIEGQMEAYVNEHKTTDSDTHKLDVFQCYVKALRDLLEINQEIRKEKRKLGHAEPIRKYYSQPILYEDLSSVNRKAWEDSKEDRNYW